MFSYIHNISTFVKPHASRSHFALFLRPLWFGARNCSSSRSLSDTFPEDPDLDAAILEDQKLIVCAKVVNGVARTGSISLLEFEHYRRRRLHIHIKMKTFLERNPGLFDVRTRLTRTGPMPYIRIRGRLQSFLEEEKKIMRENEWSMVVKLCKLLLMSKNKALRVEKLNTVKREFGIADDFLVSLVPRYPRYFKSVNAGQKKWTLELVSWEPEFAKSAMQTRAEEEARLKGVEVLPSFRLTLLPENEWIGSWMELPYISPYEDASGFDVESMEMDKWMVGVFHELLSLTLLKGVQLPLLATLSGTYGFPRACLNIFRRHNAIFYVSLKIKAKFILLREAYVGGELIDRDPLLVIRDKFLALAREGWEKHEAALNEKQIAGTKSKSAIGK